MSMQRGTWPSLLIAIIMLVGCSEQPGSENNSDSTYQTITVQQNQLQPFVTFEEDSIAQPQDIEVLSNGNVAILDSKLKTVFVYNSEGDRLVSFGRSGRGPGEFSQPVNMEQTPSHLYIYDQAQFMWQKYTHGGSFVESVQNVGGGLLASDIDMVADGEYLIPANGNQESLIQYRNTSTNQNNYFGTAMGDSIRGGVSLEKNAEQASKGEVPDLFKNMVFLAHTDDTYYAFLKSYGRLLKYDRSGALQWDKKIDLPLIDKIHQEYVEANKNRQEGSNLAMLIYARDMDVTQQTVYLLMNAPGDDNQQLIVLNEQGSIQTVYNLAYPKGEFNQLAISKPGSSVDQIYLVDRSLGRVYSMPLTAE